MEIEQAPVAAEPAVVSEPQVEPQVETAVDGGESPTPPEPVSRIDALEKAFDQVDASEDDSGRLRGPDGKFVAKEAEPTEQAAEPTQKAPEQATTIDEAPSRFSPDGKEAWKNAPEAVRGEALRAIRELEDGLQQKDAQLEPLRPFFEMAEQHGVTVHDTLQSYINMENTLRTDLKGGMGLLAQRLGLSLPDLAAQLTGQAQPEGQQAESQRENVILRQEIEGLRAELGKVSNTVKQTTEANTQKFVEDFASQHERFDELSDEIARLLQTGYADNLDSAYDIASRLKPVAAPVNPAPVLQEPQPQAVQPRQPLSVTGSPSAGSNPSIRQPSGSRQEALSRAFDQVGL